MNLNDNNYRNDIIFKEPTSTGNRRFLVRMLNNTGAVSNTVPAYVDSIQNPVNNLSSNNKLPRLLVESNSIDPKFKILLFAYNIGDPLPVTTWNASRNRLFVTNNGVTKTISFPVDTAGRTNIELFDGVLPIGINLTGGILNKSVAKLTFQTKEQQTAALFEVEKSTDGIRFASVKNLQPSNRLSDNYIWIDSSLLDNNYYRIKCVTKDGQTIYNNSILIRLNKSENIKVYPNPITTDRIFVQLGKVQAGNYTLVLHDVNGKNVYTKKFYLSNGEKLLQVNLPHLSKGAFQ